MDSDCSLVTLRPAKAYYTSEMPTGQNFVTLVYQSQTAYSPVA